MRERKREGERESERGRERECERECVCVCVCDREGGGERGEGGRVAAVYFKPSCIFLFFLDSISQRLMMLHQELQQKT